MQEAVTGQLIFFFASVIYGGFLLLVYDIIRGFRRAFLHKAVFISLEDLCFWLFVGVSSFQFLCWYNQGELRGFFFMGLGFGMLLYHIGFSSQVVGICLWLFGQIQHVGGKILRRVRRPISRMQANMKWQLKKEKKHVKMALKKRSKRGDANEDKR